MLDYEKLSTQFTEQLNTFDTQKLQEWLEFDQMRLNQDFLLDGEVRYFVVEQSEQIIISDPNEKISIHITLEPALAA